MPNKSKRTPCLDCEDRHVLCHSDCKAYLEWKRMLAAAREKRFAENETTSFLYDDAIRRKWKSYRGTYK